MPRCCRAGAAPRRSTAPSRPATRETGVTIMQMDAGLDTGDMLLVERVAIAADDTTGSPARQAGGAGRPADRRGAGAGGLRRPAAGAAAGRRRDLRAQDREGRSRDRLVAAGRGDRAAHPRLRSVPGRQQRAGRRDAQALARAGRRRSRGDAPARHDRWPSTPDGIDVRCGQGVLRLTAAAARRRQAAGRGRLPARLRRCSPGMRFERRLMFFLPLRSTAIPHSARRARTWRRWPPASPPGA